MLNTYKNQIVSLSVLPLTLAVVFTFTANSAYANSCEGPYGKDCDNDAEVEKKVRKAGDDEWKDTVKDVKKGQKVEFRLKVKNTGDVDLEDLELIDELPEELDLLNGDLTRDIDNLEDGDSKTYTLTVEVSDDEFKSGVSKCVVNLVRLKGDLNDDDNKETIDTDTATVCYGQGVTELPKTGNDGLLASTLASIAMITAGLGIKRFAI